MQTNIRLRSIFDNFALVVNGRIEYCANSNVLDYLTLNTAVSLRIQENCLQVKKDENNTGRTYTCMKYLPV